MGNIILGTTLKTVLAYIFALALARIMGRKLISQMTFFDFIVGVTMGTLVANAMVDASNPTSSSTIALVLITILSVCIAFFNIKSFKFKKLKFG